MDEPPEADKGQIHCDSEAQSNDKGWKEGIKKKKKEIWSGQQGEGCLCLGVVGSCRRDEGERKKERC